MGVLREQVARECSSERTEVRAKPFHSQCTPGREAMEEKDCPAEPGEVEGIFGDAASL